MIRSDHEFWFKVALLGHNPYLHGYVCRIWEKHSAA